MADLSLRYLRCLLFSSEPMNQQEETEITEKGEQKLKGGKAGGGQGTEKGNIRACLIQTMAHLFSVISVASCSVPKHLPNHDCKGSTRVVKCHR